MKRRTRIRAGVAAIVAALFACGLALPSQERLLMREAKRITAVNNGLDSPCLWLSNHSVLLLRYHANGDGFEFVLHDTNTGMQKPLDTLNSKYRADLKSRTFTSPPVQAGSRSLPQTIHIPPRCSLSPDGKWLLLHGYRLPNAPLPVYGPYIAVTLDGSKEIRWSTDKRPQFMYPLWLHDNQSWVQPSYDRHLSSIVLRSLREPGRSKRLPILSAETGQRFAGEAGDGHLLVAEEKIEGPFATVRMADYDCHLPGVAVHKYSLRLPIFAYLVSVIPSRKGDRLAWVLSYDANPPLTQWLRLPLRPQLIMAVWVSALDGTNMKEVGHKLILPAADYSEFIYQLQWLPGDKQLSFLCQNALYTVPVP